MPTSSVMSHTPSHSSAGSRRSNAHRYHTISRTANVDDTLFGDPNHIKQRNSKLEDAQEIVIERQAAERSAGRVARNISSVNKKKKAPKETVNVITKDLIRNLIVPKEDPSGGRVVLSYMDYLRVKGRSRIKTKEELEREVDQLSKAKEETMSAVEQRKKQLKEYDISRQKNTKLNDLEEEAKEKAEHLLQKAMRQRQEQEDEIKHLNELILNAKCHAIRDAQIIEKGKISAELVVDEKRLDNMMELERRNAIAIQEKIEAARHEEEVIGAGQIIDQIKENEEERLLDLEKKDLENKAMRKYLGQLMEEEKSKLERKKAEQDQLREQLNHANEDIIRRRDVVVEQERALEAKVFDFQKRKAEREAAYEAEQERIKIAKEKEVARLRALQERASDEQAERDAIRAKRAMEQNERDWRRKEAEEATQKKITEGELKFARTQQLAQKEHYLAVQAARERAEFERVLRAQKELIEKENNEEVEVAQRRSKYSTEVRRQILEKEKQRILERNAFFDEGVQMEEEAKLRRVRLEEAKTRKINELRNAGIPEKYLAQVERKINHPQHVST